MTIFIHYNNFNLSSSFNFVIKKPQVFLVFSTSPTYGAHNNFTRLFFMQFDFY